MASPLLSSLCCEFHCNAAENASCRLQIPTWQLLFSDATKIYNILCVVSSVFGIIGAVYQLRLRLQVFFRQSSPVPEAIDRQSKIIFWLAVADGIASLGILIRSCVWMGLGFSGSGVLIFSPFSDFFCAFISGWVQYFYICTYLWTIMFAVDTYMNAIDRNKCSLWLYHILAWGISLIICAVGLFVLYYPGLDSCRDNSKSRRLPHYLASYIPILCVMGINPILFWKSSRRVQRDLELRGSSLNEQKEIVGEVMSRFFSVILIFYVCWLPNVINGALLLSLSVDVKDRQSLVHSVIIALWQIMALLNPVQGFLNSLVYCNVALWPNTVLMTCRRRRRHSTAAVPTSAPVEAETGRTAEGEENVDQESGSSSDHEPIWNMERSPESPLLLFR